MTGREDQSEGALYCPNCNQRGSHNIADNSIQEDEWECDNENCRVSLYYVGGRFAE